MLGARARVDRVRVRVEGAQWARSIRSGSRPNVRLLPPSFHRSLTDRLTDRARASARARALRLPPRRTAPLTLLTIAPLTLTFPAALAAYLFVAHTLGAPGGAALEAALLAGGVTALVGLFCVGLVRDTCVCFLFSLLLGRCASRARGGGGARVRGVRGARGWVCVGICVC